MIRAVRVVLAAIVAALFGVPAAAVRAAPSRRSRDSSGTALEVCADALNDDWSASGAPLDYFLGVNVYGSR